MHNIYSDTERIITDIKITVVSNFSKGHYSKNTYHCTVYISNFQGQIQKVSKNNIKMANPHSAEPR